MRRFSWAALAVALLASPALAQPLPETNDALFAPFDLPTPNQYRNADGRPGPEYWQNRNDYRITASLDPVTNTVAGTVVLTYTNHSPEPLPYLWFHLEQNLFTPEARGASGNRAAPAVDPAHGFRLGRVTVGDATVAPVVTDTRMRIDLPRPVAARGGTVEVTIPYSFVVPGDRTPRMGRLETEHGTVYALAQWYPRVAVYDDVSGWNTLPYLGQSEFYLGYGTFDVELTVPASMTVVATGALRNESDVYPAPQRERLARARGSDAAVPIVTEADMKAGLRRTGTSTWRFRAENVRDFAWGASSAFLLDAARAAIRQDDGSTNNVLVMSAYPVEGVGTASQPGWEEATRYGRASIVNNSQWYPYPYPVAISVASHIGGMEYPMLHFSRVSARHYALFGVIDHELGHNWFPMIVGSDERRHAWMDEGFDTFINYSSNVTFYDENEDASLPGYGMAQDSSRYVVLLNSDPFVRYAQAQARFERPILTYTDQLPPQAVGWDVYRKPGKGLKILRDAVLGPERFDAAFKTYIRRWAYKHPQPADFFRTMEDVSGEDLGWFWRGWFDQTGTYDAALTALSADGDLALATVQNETDLVLPVVVAFRFTDGSLDRVDVPAEAFFSTDTFQASTPLRGRTLERATLDPDRFLPDTDRANDTRTL